MKLRNLFLTIICVLVPLATFAQLNGSFSYGQDGHIYFGLHNTTNRYIPVTWYATNANLNQQRVGSMNIYPNQTFWFGVNENWVWQRGETFTVKYSNGKSVYWTCPETDPFIANQYNNNMQGGNGTRPYSNNNNEPFQFDFSMDRTSTEKCFFCKGNVICGVCGGTGGTWNSIGFYPCGGCNATGKCVKCNGRGYNTVVRQQNPDGSLDVYRSDGSYSHTDETGTIGYTGDGKMYIQNRGGSKTGSNSKNSSSSSSSRSTSSRQSVGCSNCINGVSRASTVYGRPNWLVHTNADGEKCPYCNLKTKHYHERCAHCNVPK